MSGFRFIYAPRTAFFLITLLISTAAHAAPDADLWDRWTSHDPDSSIIVDHGPWDRFLETHVRVSDDGIARLAYGAVADADKRDLQTYLRQLAATPVSALNRPQQRAYWINLYNAATVAIVLRAYPVRSIRDIDISPGLFSNGPWDKKLIRVEGERLSLNDIEHRILRPIWQDPRIHYAVNCAALGCPNLSDTAFTAENTEALLETAASAYINHPRGVEARDGRLIVSSIYRWFEEDFGDGDRDVIAHLRRYAEPPLAAALNGLRRIDEHRYDWALNDLTRSR